MRALNTKATPLQQLLDYLNYWELCYTWRDQPKQRLYSALEKHLQKCYQAEDRKTSTIHTPIEI